ncbi:MAG: MBL fold metallo-hydrolase [Thermomicrobiales bacterium]|nr:MBL fold metallo-hydrolase [Thermomicrobiales bacterium]
MIMEVTVLGGSAAGVSPGQGCSGYLVAHQGTRIVLDLGPGTLPELRLHTDYRTLDAVVLSHLHLDHMLDVFALRYALAYNPVGAPAPVPLWVPPGGIAFLTEAARVFAGADGAASFYDVFVVNEYDPSEPLALGSLTLRFHPTVHYVPCWAIRASITDNTALFYTADTGPTADLLPLAIGASLVIAEGTATGDSDEPLAARGHLTPTEAARLARDAGAEMLLLTHLWAENDPNAALAEAQAVFGGPVLLASPGTHIVVPARC